MTPEQTVKKLRKQWNQEWDKTNGDSEWCIDRLFEWMLFELRKFQAKS